MARSQLQDACVWACERCTSCDDPTTLLGTVLPHWGKEGIFIPNQASAQRRMYLEYLSNNRNPLLTTSAQKALGSRETLLASVLGKPRREKIKGCFQKQTHIGVGVFSLRPICLERRMFQMLVLWSLGESPLKLIPLAGWVMRSLAWEKKVFSSQIRLCHQGEHMWSWFQARELSSRAPMPTEICGVTIHIRPRSKEEAYLGKGQEMLSRVTPHWGWGSFPE